MTASQTAAATTRSLEVDGVRTRVVEHGDPDSPAVVLMHGVGGHLEAFDRNVAALASSHRVIRFDLPGHGWSSAPDGRSYELDGYLAHLDALLDVLDVGQADLVGLSLGGWIAARYALARPYRVRRLVLAAPGGVLADPTVMAALRTLSSAAAAAPTAESVRARLDWLMALPGTVTDDLVATRLAIYQRDGATAAMAKILCLQDPQIRARNLLTPVQWSAITQPTLVIWGDHDATGPAVTGERLASWLPGGRFAPMTNVGHWPQFEDPVAFNGLVLPFLNDERTAR